MSIIKQTAWFILGVGMIIGAMLLTVHFARALPAECIDKDHCAGGIRENNGQWEISRLSPDRKHLIWVQMPPTSPQRTQINRCIAYGIGIGRGVKTTDMKDPNTKKQLEQQDDWLYFCMQQARWTFCEKCQVDPAHNWDRHQSCGEAGGAAYYNDECWDWLHNLFHSPPIGELRPKSQDKVR